MADDERPVLLVVLGAGASFNVRMGDQEPGDSMNGDVPPLTDYLFSHGHLENETWGWGGVANANLIADDLRSVRMQYGEDIGFEKALSINYGELAGNPISRAKRYLGLRLYLWRMFTHFSERYSLAENRQNSYTVFCNQVVHRWAVPRGIEVVFVTMNYDTLLERALRNTGVGLAIDQYWKPEEGWAVIKPHGSISWQRLYDGLPEGASVGNEDSLMDQAASLAALSGSIPVECDFPAMRGKGWHGYAKSGGQGPTVALPALELPFENEDSPKAMLSNCPAPHLEYLTGALPRTVASIIVGWRGQDDHIVERLAPAMVGTEVQVVDPADPAEISGRLQSSWPEARLNPVQRSFFRYARGHENDDLEEFLHGAVKP